MKGQRFASKAASSKDGILKLDSSSYDELTGGERDYSVSVVLTAMDPGFKVSSYASGFGSDEGDRGKG